MNKRNGDRWSPCQGICQMAGAASLLLSIRDSRVLLNGPRWCAVIAERELAAARKEFESRLYCSEIKETDLLYGAERTIQAALEEIRGEGIPSLLGVLTSCAASLVGDDVAGICGKAALPCPSIIMDAGGFTGEFWSGYRRALLRLLEEAKLERAARPESNQVNLLGISVWYPNWEADLAEIKRLLRLSGFSVGLCVGAPELARERLAALPEAALNLIIHPELGLEPARFLEETIGQLCMVSPAPYGFTQTLAWLEEIGRRLKQAPDLARIKEEISGMRENHSGALFALKGRMRNLYFRRAYISAPHGTALGLANALLTDFADLGDVFLRTQGPEMLIGDAPAGVNRWTDAADKELDQEEFQLLLGADRERGEIGNRRRTVYLNFFQPDRTLLLPRRPYIGIRGWDCFVADIYRTVRILDDAAG